MITGKQVVAARSLLDISQEELAKKAGVGISTLARFEKSLSEPRDNIRTSIQETLEGLGIDFIDDIGVSLAKKQNREIIGKDCYVKLLDDVFYTLKENEEMLIICSDDKVSPPKVNDSYRRIRNAGIKMRQLIEEDNQYLMGNVNEYRYIPKRFFHNNVMLVYRNKVASVLHNEEKVIIIEDNGFSDSLRNLFEFMWSITKKPKASIANEKF